MFALWGKRHTEVAEFFLTSCILKAPYCLKLHALQINGCNKMDVANETKKISLVYKHPICAESSTVTEGNIFLQSRLLGFFI